MEKPMVTTSDNEPGRCLKTLVLVYDVILIILGLGCASVGIWMHAYDNVHAYLFILRRDPNDNWMLAATGIFIGAGLMIAGVGILGIIAVIKKIKKLLFVYICILAITILLELVAGFLIVHLRHDIHRHVKQSMKAQISGHYTFDNSVGHAWNRVQVMRRCCGADGSWDYRQSDWWHAENPGVENIEEALVHVPETCCVLNFNQDRDLSKVNPQKPEPKDPKRCQEDAAGNKDGSDNLNGRGCFATLLDFIWLHIDLIIGIGLALGFLQIIGIVVAMIYMRMMPEKEY